MTSIGTMLSLKDEYCTEIEDKKKQFRQNITETFFKNRSQL